MNTVQQYHQHEHGNHLDEEDEDDIILAENEHDDDPFLSWNVLRNDRTTQSQKQPCPPSASQIGRIQRRRDLIEKRRSRSSRRYGNPGRIRRQESDTEETNGTATERAAGIQSDERSASSEDDDLFRELLYPKESASNSSSDTKDHAVCEEVTKPVIHGLDSIRSINDTLPPRITNRSIENDDTMTPHPDTQNKGAVPIGNGVHTAKVNDKHFCPPIPIPKTNDLHSSNSINAIIEEDGDGDMNDENDDQSFPNEYETEEPPQDTMDRNDQHQHQQDSCGKQSDRQSHQRKTKTTLSLSQSQHKLLVSYNTPKPKQSASVPKSIQKTNTYEYDSSSEDDANMNDLLQKPLTRPIIDIRVGRLPHPNKYSPGEDASCDTYERRSVLSTARSVTKKQQSTSCEREHDGVGRAFSSHNKFRNYDYHQQSRPTHSNYRSNQNQNSKSRKRPVHVHVSPPPYPQQQQAQSLSQAASAISKRAMRHSQPLFNTHTQQSQKSSKSNLISSIEGIRPNHWSNEETNTRFTRPRPGFPTNAFNQKQKKSAKVKEKALLSQASKKRIQRLASFSNSNPRQNQHQHQHPPSCHTDDPQTATAAEHQHHSSQGQTTSIGEICSSLRPALFSSSQSQNNHAVVVSIDDDENAMNGPAVSQLSQFDGMKPNRKRGAATMGPLMQELLSIRRDIESTHMRLRSEVYPLAGGASTPLFGKRRRTVPSNKKCQVFMDVTILGSPSATKNWTGGGGGSGSDSGGGGTASVLGYVHQTSMNWPTVDNGHPKDGMDSSNTVRKSCSVTNDDKVAWIWFSFETIREQTIQKGSQFRIYDCLLLDASSSLQQRYETKERIPNHPAAGEQTCGADDGGHDYQIGQNGVANRYFPIVICTQLCEPYPSALPPLCPIPDSLTF